MDSLRRYDPDQVLRDSLSQRRLWRRHPGREGNLIGAGTQAASRAWTGQRQHFGRLIFLACHAEHTRCRHIDDSATNCCRHPFGPLMRFTRRLSVAALLLCPFGLIAPQKMPVSSIVAKGTPPAIAALFKLTRAEVSGDRARDVVVFMDQWFRVPGNTGFNASLDRVESILRDAGYVKEDAASPKARLVYRIESKTMRGPAWDPADASITIEGQPAPLMKWSTNRNMLAINSWPTPDTGIVAELVDAGKGLPPDLDKANVKGKFVVADASLGSLYTNAVVARGALGVLAYRMPEYTKPEVHRNSVQFSSIPYDTISKSLGIALSKNGIDGLRAALAKGPTKLRITSRTRFFPSANRTIVAEVRGTVAPNERFVFSAHAQEPGANDNASGVGALSDMARVLAKLNRSGAAVPKRTITMLFGNEIEQTRDFLAADTARTRDVRWGLSLDMVGEDTKKTGGTFLIEKMLDPSAIWTRGEEKHSEWGGSDGATARALVAEVERAAIARLDTELALSRIAVANGGDAAKERDILATWTDYYVKSIATMSDIEVGGSSAATTAAIAAAQTNVQLAGTSRLARLGAK